MGCLSIQATRIGDGLRLNAGRLGEGLSLRAEREGEGISVNFLRIGGCPSVAASRKGNGLVVNCSLVCSVGVSLYLEVTPEVLWLVDDEGIFNVESNTEWQVE